MKKLNLSKWTLVEKGYDAQQSKWGVQKGKIFIECRNITAAITLAEVMDKCVKQEGK